MELLSIGDFAKRVGVSYVMVYRAMKQGRIVGTNGGPNGTVVIDFDTQHKAWTENCKMPQSRPNKPNGGRPRKDGKPTAKTEQRRPMAPTKTEQRRPTVHQNTEPEKPEAEPDQPVMSINAIQRERELVKLQLDQLKLKEAEGELVNAAEVQRLGRSLATGIISVLYNIPERCSDEIAGMTDAHAIHKLLTSEIDAAVETIRKKYVDLQ